MKRRLLAILMSLVLMIGIMPAAALAAEVVDGGKCGDNLTWTLDEGGVLTISGEGDMMDCVYYNDAPWSGYRGMVRSVVIKDGATSIGERAFEDFVKIVNVAIADTVTQISDRAFNGCESLTSIEIPANVTVIEDTFYGCTSLEEIIVDEDNEYYCNSENGALLSKDMSELLVVPAAGAAGNYVIPEGVKIIRREAISLCDNMTELTIPASLETIEGYSIFHCYSLKKIVVDENSKNFCSDSYGVLFDKDKTTLVFFPNGITEDYVVPSTVTAIQEYAFFGCSVEKIKFVGDAPEINYYSFNGASFSAFYPLNNDTWTDEFFENTSNVNWYGYDPDAPEIIVSGEYGENLTWTLTYDGVLTVSGTGNIDEDFGGTMFVYDHWSYDTVIIEEGVESLGDYAFGWNHELKTVTIPASVTEMGLGVFFDAAILEKIIVDEDNKHYCSDKDGVLYNKDKTELILAPAKAINGSYSISNGVEVIGYNAFSTCTEMTELIIPASTSYIGYDAFSNCSSLESFVVDENNKDFSSNNGVLFNKNRTAIIKAPVNGVKGEYAVPYGVIIISDNAFAFCNSMTVVEIPETVSYLGDNAFMYCDNLEKIIVDKANADFSNDKNGILYNKEMTTLIKVPSEVGKIVKIPASVDYIEYLAFWDCDNIEVLKFEGDAPIFENDMLYWGSIVIYYPENNQTWTESVMNSIGFDFVWRPYNPSERITGDVDGNGEVSNADLILVARYVVELYDEDTAADIEAYGDMNGDGLVANTDIINIARIIVGLD